MGWFDADMVPKVFSDPTFRSLRKIEKACRQWLRDVFLPNGVNVFFLAHLGG